MICTFRRWSSIYDIVDRRGGLNQRHVLFWSLRAFQSHIKFISYRLIDQVFSCKVSSSFQQPKFRLDKKITCEFIKITLTTIKFSMLYRLKLLHIVSDIYIFKIEFFNMYCYHIYPTKSLKKILKKQRQFFLGLGLRV